MDTKEKILKTFYTLVSEKGYEKASMNDVVKMAEISKGAIYHHFNGKEHLFLETISYIFFHENETLFAIDGITKSNYKESLKKIGTDIIISIKNQPNFNKFFYEFLIASIRYDEIKSYMKIVLNNYIKIFEKLFLALKEKKIVDKNLDPNLIAHKFFIFLDVLSLYQTYEIDFDYITLWNSFVDDLFK